MWSLDDGIMFEIAVWGKSSLACHQTSLSDKSSGMYKIPLKQVTSLILLIRQNIACNDSAKAPNWHVSGNTSYLMAHKIAKN